jgi:hypothetical protein
VSFINLPRTQSPPELVGEMDYLPLPPFMSRIMRTSMRTMSTGTVPDLVAGASGIRVVEIN